MSSHIVTLPKRGDDLMRELDNDTIQTQNIHIRVQQRRGSSYITTVECVDEAFDLKLILRAIKKTYHCNGSINSDPDFGDILQFSGDQRENIKSWLCDEGICEKNQIITHGF
jgi:translation initiation factor 1